MLVNEQFCPQKPRGFLVVEGVNGAGKSSLIAKVAEHLRSHDREVVTTREPGGSPLGQKLRTLLLDAREISITPTAELLLFAADRVEHIRKTIEPALAEGKVVISDRYHYSTTAFQGSGRGLPHEEVAAANHIAARSCVPDLVLLLDLDVTEGLRRTRQRNALRPGQGAETIISPDPDRFEDEHIAFHERIRASFLKQAREHPEPFRLLDASKSPEEVFEAARPNLDSWVATLKQTRRVVEP